MGILEKIGEIEKEIARTQKNKVIFAESLEVLVMALEVLHEEAKPLGLEVSWLKTKVQVLGDLLDEAVQSVHACGEDIEILETTEYHLGVLKAKLAKYRSQLLEPQGKKGEKGDGFDVMKSGDARVALIGFPSVGKSTLLSTLTNTQSVAASYEFTTLTCIPGVIEYKGANIQLLDLPGIIEGASQGKGRGRQVRH
ncbi:putative GTP-binding protein C02F5.3 [Chionoecetes opilio]|uniref:Putative GTP-binding protein C02F5.3 n=1 Tax=Chionoecetes opilio TaxID=41210 RepID=A0A8J4YGS7_CHIOP|nr:putative GTP-binding protein C02F5.3 [Chionoecetes opilio]